MTRPAPHVDRSLFVRLASAAGAAALSAVVLGSVAATMAAAPRDASYASATEVTILPSRIEVVGARATTTVRNAAAPHVG